MSQKGFTLIEVLVALVVLAIALFAVVMATTRNSQNAAYLQERTLAQIVGLNIYSELELGLIKIPPDHETQQGTREMLGKTWYWMAAFKPTSIHSMLVTEITVGLNPTDSTTKVKGFLRE